MYLNTNADVTYEEDLGVRWLNEIEESILAYLRPTPFIIQPDPIVWYEPDMFLDVDSSLDFDTLLQQINIKKRQREENFVLYACIVASLTALLIYVFERFTQ